MMKALIWFGLIVLVAFKLKFAKGVCQDKLSYCARHARLCGQVPDLSKLCRKTCNLCTELCDPEQLRCEYFCELDRFGKARCSCPTGLTINSDGRTCSDINECLTDGVCLDPEKPSCTNTKGSYVCTKSPLCHLQANSVSYYNRTECCKKEQGQCGQNLVSTSLSITGQDAIVAMWPWTVFASANGRSCTGALISNQWVLIAAHCFSCNRGAYQDITLSLGMHSTAGHNNRTLRIGVDRVITHPNYNYPKNDISLLRLRYPITFNEFIHPICMPSGEVPIEGASCFQSSFETEFYAQGVRKTMREIGMYIASGADCQNNLGKAAQGIHSHQLCAQHDQSSITVCPGESGGPLVCQRCNSCSWYLAGLASYGGACPETENFGLYTAVESFEDWINSNTNMSLSNNAACRRIIPAWRPWGVWGSCSKSCNSGLRSRSRTCNGRRPGSIGCEGSSSEVENCNTNDCPSWSRYGSWSTCSETCGIGVRRRTRLCRNGKVGQTGCHIGGTIETSRCLERSCWSDWSNWGSCTPSCGSSAVRTRTRLCRNDLGCSGISSDEESCPYKSCNTVPCASNTNDTISGDFCGKYVDWCTRYVSLMSGSCNKTCCLHGPIKGYSDWSAWSTCTTRCGEGEHIRKRICTQAGGCDDTTGVVIPTRYTKACAPLSCNRLVRTYSPWSDCSVSCGGGLRRRTENLCRTVDDCTQVNLNETCSNHTCPTWSSWQQWSACNVTCGEGLRNRKRVCDGGSESSCIGESRQTQDCNDGPCYGTWTTWSPWECNVTCGIGISSRFRTCQYEDNCLGNDRQEKNCTQAPCLEPCEDDLVWRSVCDYLKFLCSRDDEVAHRCQRSCNKC